MLAMRSPVTIRLDQNYADTPVARLMLTSHVQN